MFETNLFFVQVLLKRNKDVRNVSIVVFISANIGDFK